MVSFVVSPGADEAARATESGRESAFAKSELKAMIERKRRNDFVRKRELDMLRKLRRQGLTPEQLAALGSSSGMADTESSKAGDTELPPPTSMRAKIDEIEEQMAGQAIPTASRRPPLRPTAAAGPVADPGLGRPHPTRPEPPAAGASDLSAEARAVADTIIEATELDGLPSLEFEPSPGPAARASHGHAPAVAPKPPGPAATPAFVALHDSQSPSAMEVSVAEHDPDLDEAVISYANGDNDLAEQLLLAQIRQAGPTLPEPGHLDGGVRPLPRHRPAAQVRPAGRGVCRAFQPLGAAVVLDAQADRRCPHGESPQDPPHRRSGGLGLPAAAGCGSGRAAGASGC